MAHCVKIAWQPNDCVVTDASARQTTGVRLSCINECMHLTLNIGIVRVLIGFDRQHRPIVNNADCATAT